MACLCIFRKENLTAQATRDLSGYDPERSKPPLYRQPGKGHSICPGKGKGTNAKAEDLHMERHQPHDSVATAFGRILLFLWCPYSYNLPRSILLRTIEPEPQPAAFCARKGTSKNDRDVGDT